MRILIYGLNYAPEPTGIGKYTGEMTEWLAAQGHELHVITTPPYYPAWQIDPSYSAWQYRHETCNGVVIWRCPLWVKRHPSGLERLLHLASFALSSVLPLVGQWAWHPQVVVVIEPTFFCLPMGLVFTALAGSRSWLHIQDFEIDAAFELGMIPNRAGLPGIVKGIEQWLTRQFHRVSSISLPMVAKLADKGIPETQRVLFPNWVDTESIYPLSTPSSFRERLGFAPTDIVILYAGSMGKKQGLEILIEVAVHLRDHPHLRFVLSGDGVTRHELAEKAAHHQLTNVTFLPLQPLEHLNDLLNLADIHALIQKEASADLVMPSKMTGMLASGRPIVATARPDTAVGEILTQAEAGILVPPEDPQALVAALLDLVADPLGREHYGTQGRAYACQKLGKEAILQAFHSQLRLLVTTEMGA